MTIIEKSERIEASGRTFYIERYREKDMKVSLWRYYEVDGGSYSLVSDMLRNKPNVRRLK